MTAMPTLGKCNIDAPFYQAGLAGYSDAAMRMIARRHGCPYCVTEAMLDQFLINGGKGLAVAELDDQDHPIAGQLMGSHPDEIAAGAKILVGLGYDVIDINLACPVKKIKKKARGGHLLSVADEAIDILKAVIDAVGSDRPCTVKLRRGSDDSPEAAARFFKIFEAAMELGYAGATVHGRTVEQKYVGPSRWAFLKELVEKYSGESQEATKPRSQEEEGSHQGKKPLSHQEETSPKLGGFVADGSVASVSPFTIGGSGDIWHARDIFRMIDETDVDFVSVARGCIGNPWIFRQARNHLAGLPDALNMPPTLFEQRDVLLEHFELSMQLHGEKKASMMMRKFGIRFSRHHPEADDIRQAFIACKSLDDWHGVLDRFYQTDGPGIAPAQAMPEEATYASCG